MGSAPSSQRGGKVGKDTQSEAIRDSTNTNTPMDMAQVVLVVRFDTSFYRAFIFSLGC